MADPYQSTGSPDDLLNENKLRERIRTIPDVRTEVVNALQQAVRSGTYRVRDEDIAVSICRELFPGSNSTQKGIK